MRTLYQLNPVQEAQQIEKRLYERFYRIQSHQRKVLLERQDQLMKQKRRKLQIEAKSSKEIIMHPYNNSCWVSLAGFLNSSPQPDLDQIEQRRQERLKIRNQLEKNKEVIEQQSQIALFQKDEYGKVEKKKQKSKAPWRLMRELRKRQVEQNKLRLEKMQENKKNKMSNYHKY